MITLAIVVGVLVVGVLTLGATSIRAVSRLWLRHWIEHRSGGVGAMTRYLERPMRLVHAAGTASMLTVFATGSIIAMAAGLRAWVFVRDVSLFLVLLLVCGQLLPRAIARRWAASIVPVMVPVLRLVDLTLAPFQLLAGAVRQAVTRPASQADEEDLRDGLEELLREGALGDISTTEELAIISGVVQFGDKVVRDVMRSRTELFMLPDGLAPMELAQQMAASGYSRVPIYRETPDRIVGMVHVFEVFRRRGEALPAMRPVSFTAPDKSAKDLLFELLRARRQLAIVQDGDAVIGVVTLEDLLEELVGDIRDEHDDNTD
jgi:putative hemolysin